MKDKNFKNYLEKNNNLSESTLFLREYGYQLINKFVNLDEKNDIKKYHKKRENILNQNEILMMEINKKYIVLLKILLAYLFGYRQSKSDWEKRTKEYKQKLKL